MSKTAHKIYIATLFLIGIITTLYFAVKGFDYYLLPLSERFWNNSHQLLRPAGLVGHGLGIAGSLMLISGVLIYMVRKRVSIFFRFGLLKHWLEFHIFLCTLGPILIIFHTTLKLGGLVAVSFWCMIAVVLSGFIGRFIYGQIPRTIQGREIDIKELSLQELELKEKINRFLPQHYISENLSFLSDTNRYRNVTFFRSIKITAADYFSSKKILRSVKTFQKNGDDEELFEAVKNRITITRQIAMLRTMQNLFRNWHIIHLPFAMVMFVIMLIHIVVAIVFGYTWVF